MMASAALDAEAQAKRQPAEQARGEIDDDKQPLTRLMHDRYYPYRARACKPGGKCFDMSTEPSRTASLFWSCASFDFYARVAGLRLWRTVSYLGLLAGLGALVVTLFFATQVVPLLRGVAQRTAGFVLAGGRLAVTPGTLPVLYDDGPHGMLLVRVAVDQEPPAPEHRYDAMVTLRPRGADCVLCGHAFQLAWPPGLAMDVQRLDAIAFMDSWWLLMCMALFALAAAWFFVTRFALALLGGLLLTALASPTRNVGLACGFNLAAHATTPATLLSLALLGMAAGYRLDPQLVNWSWILDVLVFLVYLAGAACALPSKPLKPWTDPGPKDPFKKRA